MKKMLVVCLFCLFASGVSFGQNNVQMTNQNRPSIEDEKNDKVDSSGCKLTPEKECKPETRDEVPRESRDIPETVAPEKPLEDEIEQIDEPIDQLAPEINFGEGWTDAPQFNRFWNLPFDTFRFDPFAPNEFGEFPCFFDSQNIR